MVFLVTGVDEPGEEPWAWGSARCVPLDYELQEELSTTSAYCFRVGDPFVVRDGHVPLHGAEAVLA